ncbi:unnamed protein product [marine sediment metagenome]|uniref:Uncharacterized protein n=1 Tax=marine sediment metagenome TaxID=412755 RepID=X0XSV3_9ZZZZ
MQCPICQNFFDHKKHPANEQEIEKAFIEIDEVLKKDDHPVHGPNQHVLAATKCPECWKVILKLNDFKANTKALQRG